MKTLITPSQAVALAFADGEYLAPEVITDADIAAAGHRYIEPVAGSALCEALVAGRYPDLLADYVAPALAMAVRTMVQRALNVRTGQMGLSVPDCSGSQTAVQSATAELQRSIVARRRALLARLSDHLAEYGAEFPEYDASHDAMKHCTIDGGIVQIH